MAVSGDLSDWGVHWKRSLKGETSGSLLWSLALGCTYSEMQRGTDNVTLCLAKPQGLEKRNTQLDHIHETIKASDKFDCKT